MVNMLGNLFLTIHLHFIVGYCLFWIFNRLTERYHTRVHFRSVLKTGRFVLLFSLILPITMTQIPEERAGNFLPFSYVSLPELPEGDLLLPGSGKAGVMSTPTPAAQQVRQWVEKRLSGHLLFALYGLVALGVSLSLFRQFLSYRSVIRLLKRTHEIKRVGRVSVVVSDDISIPFSTCIDGRARVVVPARLLSDRSGFRSVLRHELQHHRQHDRLVARFSSWRGSIALFYGA